MKQKGDQTIESEEVQALMNAFLAIRTKDEMTIFLRDILTIKEIETFSMRWKAANMLDQGIPYLEIERRTGLSSATIARVSEFLKYGYDGYRKIIDRINKKTR